MQIDESCFAASTGYGYNDRGREKLDQLYARVFGAEAGIVRPQFVSGTHAIACALYGSLRPGGRLLSLTGKPYETLQKVLGLNDRDTGMLAELNITYEEADFTTAINETALDNLLAEKADVVLLQRSRGYSLRRALRTSHCRSCPSCKKEAAGSSNFVDNCYGNLWKQKALSCRCRFNCRFSDKNPGGGIATGGGYSRP